MERPKVRFSQTHNIPSDQRETQTAGDTSICKGKVVIKSIVPTNFPIKISKDGKRVLVTGPNYSHKIADQTPSQNHGQLHPCLYTTPQSNDESESRNSSSNFELESSFDQNLTRHQNSENKSVRSSIEFQKCMDDLAKITINDSGEKSIEQMQYAENRTGYEERDKVTNTQSSSSNIPCITCGDTSDEDSDIEVIKIINTSRQSNSISEKDSNHKKMTNKKHTRNSGLESKVSTNRANKIINNADKSKISQSADKENCSKLNKSVDRKEPKILPKKSKVLRDATNPWTEVTGNVKSKKPMKKNQQKSWVKPHSKLRDNQLEEKFPHSQVKKSTVFNVEKKNPKVVVEAEPAPIQCVRDDSHHLRVIEEKKSISSMNLLARPEYNSTINIVKKLKELQSEKPNYDLENLPEIYKNRIHSKVSAALEFGPYETVYKDLVSLTIDEHQLPPRLTRSKDPEPRDRDIMPDLSDFYHPKITRQYLTVAHPTTPCPVSVNTLNAFTISDRIRTWKISRNNS